MAKGKRVSQKKRNDEYLKIFMQFDVDSSGGVDKHEIIKVLKACGIQMDEAQAEDLINQIDADGGGQVEQDQFIQFLKKEDMNSDYNQEELRKLFQFFLPPDKKTIGFIQLKKMFQNLGQNVKDSQISAMILFADKNKDGEIDFDEFCKIMNEI